MLRCCISLFLTNPFPVPALSFAMRLDFSPDVFKSRYLESAATAGWIDDHLFRFWINDVYDHLNDVAWSEELSFLSSECGPHKHFEGVTDRVSLSFRDAVRLKLTDGIRDTLII